MDWLLFVLFEALIFALGFAGGAGWMIRRVEKLYGRVTHPETHHGN